MSRPELDDLVRGADGEPVFRAPWEAKVFALQQTLLDASVFTANEWAETLGAEIAAGGAKDDAEGTAYFRYWLRALNRLVIQKGIATPEIVSETAEAWARAARVTPHGAPIDLEKGSRA